MNRTSINRMWKWGLCQVDSPTTSVNCGFNSRPTVAKQLRDLQPSFQGKH
jgi:hypothetical protein